VDHEAYLAGDNHHLPKKRSDKKACTLCPKGLVHNMRVDILSLSLFPVRGQSLNGITCLMGSRGSIVDCSGMKKNPEFVMGDADDGQKNSTLNAFPDSDLQDAPLILFFKAEAAKEFITK
jgi:hypothetical protein